MALDGYDLGKKWKRLYEERQVNKRWREISGNYWYGFIHEAKKNGFSVKFNDREKTIIIIKEDKELLSLHYLKEMTNEDDLNVRYSLKLVDKKVQEDEEKELMNYLKKMKGKKESEIIKGVMKKFNLGKDDAERAVELIKEEEKCQS